MNGLIKQKKKKKKKGKRKKETSIFKFIIPVSKIPKYKNLMLTINTDSRVINKFNFEFKPVKLDFKCF